MSTGNVSRESARGDVTSVVASALAAREDVRVDELSPPLYDVIDPEALEELFRDTSGRVTFEYRDYEVTVDDEYTVEIRTSQ
jgi:hypothetical protein